MSTEIISFRYAKALIKLTGHDLETCAPVFRCFETLEELFAEPHASKVLKSPAMPEELKKSLLDYALNLEGADQLMKNFVYTVLEHGRVAFLPDIGKAFVRLVREANGRVTATVISAIELVDEDKSVIEKELGALLKKDIEMATEVDESLLGGFVVKVGHSQLDLSLKSKLDALTNVAL